MLKNRLFSDQSTRKQVRKHNPRWRVRSRRVIPQQVAQTPINAVVSLGSFEGCFAATSEMLCAIPTLRSSLSSRWIADPNTHVCLRHYNQQIGVLQSATEKWAFQLQRSKVQLLVAAIQPVSHSLEATDTASSADMSCCLAYCPPMAMLQWNSDFNCFFRSCTSEGKN